MLKNSFYILFALLFSVNIVAQKKEKIKGSKIVTISIKELQSFQHIEVKDNLEVFFVKAEKPSIEIEADDNLHEVINYEISTNTLRLSTLKDVTSFKKLAIRINYDSELQLISARNESTIKALADLELETIAVKNYDNSRSYLNVKATNFSLVLDDKAEAELNIKATNVTLELSKSAELKGLIATTDLKVDLHQKSEVKLEGTTSTAKIRLDNSARFEAKKFKIEDLEAVLDGASICEVLVDQNLNLSASGRSETFLYGDAKIEITKFSNSTTLYKKEK
jgi:hypothetical protein